MPASNPVLAELHDRYAGERMDQLAGDRTTAAARELIVQRMPDGAPTCERIAAAMGMSKRAFQRRLPAEGTSFHQWPDGTRRILAERYLASDTVSLAEVTNLLGFSDQSNFTRASERWFEGPPRKVRSRLTANRPDARQVLLRSESLRKT